MIVFDYMLPYNIPNIKFHSNNLFVLLTICLFSKKYIVINVINIDPFDG